MLQAAAQHKQIEHILVFATLADDLDTVLYIATHYNTAEHITHAEDRATLTALVAAVEQEAAQAAVKH